MKKKSVKKAIIADKRRLLYESNLNRIPASEIFLLPWFCYLTTITLDIPMILGNYFKFYLVPVGLILQQLLRFESTA